MTPQNSRPQTRSQTRLDTEHTNDHREAAQTVVVTNLLYTNHVTSAHERPVIKASRQRYQAKIENLDQKIAKHYAAIERLEEKRDEQESIVQYHSKLLQRSPARSLPTEILAEIFHVYCGMYGVPVLALMDHKKHGGAKPFFHARMLVLHICRRWRAVALSDTRLWRTFLLLGSRMSSNAELCRRWIDRAASAPLDLSYAADDNRDCLQLLIDHIPRCSKLQLLLQMPQLKVADSKLLKQLSCAPMLTTLTVFSNRWDCNFMQKWTAAFLQNAPQLSSVTTDMPVEYLAPLSRQLHHLSIRHTVTPYEIIQYIGSLEVLQSIRIETLTPLEPQWRVPHDAPPPHIVHTHLRSIYCRRRRYQWSSFMNGPQRSAYGLLLDGLTLPNLNGLDIDPPPFSLASLKGLFERSSCGIESLSLHLEDSDWASLKYSAESDIQEQVALVKDLAALIKLDQVNHHLSQFTLHIDDDDGNLETIPGYVLGMLRGQSGELPNLTHLRFAALSLQQPFVMQVLENRVLHFESCRLVKLQSLTIDWETEQRGSKRLKGEVSFLDAFEQNGTVIEVVPHKRAPDIYCTTDSDSC